VSDILHSITMVFMVDPEHDENVTENRQDGKHKQQQSPEVVRPNDLRRRRRRRILPETTSVSGPAAVVRHGGPEVHAIDNVQIVTVGASGGLLVSNNDVTSRRQGMLMDCVDTMSSDGGWSLVVLCVVGGPVSDAIERRHQVQHWLMTRRVLLYTDRPHAHSKQSFDLPQLRVMLNFGSKLESDLSLFSRRELGLDLRELNYVTSQYRHKHYALAEKAFISGSWRQIIKMLS